MNALQVYVSNHTEVLTRTSNLPGVDVGIFKVGIMNNPKAEELRQLIDNHAKALFCNINPLDGIEHSYLQLGGNGNLRFVLIFMGLCESVGLSKTFTPRVMVGETLKPDLETFLINKGLITMQETKQSKKTLANKAPLASLLGNFSLNN